MWDTRLQSFPQLGSLSSAIGANGLHMQGASLILRDVAFSFFTCRFAALQLQLRMARAAYIALVALALFGAASKQTIVLSTVIRQSLVAGNGCRPLTLNALWLTAAQRQPDCQPCHA
jgi:hypothetical protein